MKSPALVLVVGLALLLAGCGGSGGDAKRYLSRTFLLAPRDVRAQFSQVAGEVPDGRRLYASLNATALAGRRLALGFRAGAHGGPRYAALRRAFTRSLAASEREAAALSRG